jgi:hypothetical protein
MVSQNKKQGRIPVFYFVVPPGVSQLVIVIMYHLVPTPESFVFSVDEGNS